MYKGEGVKSKFWGLTLQPVNPICESGTDQHTNVKVSYFGTTRRKIWFDSVDDLV